MKNFSKNIKTFNNNMKVSPYVVNLCTHYRNYEVEFVHNYLSLIIIEKLIRDNN